MGYIIQLEKRPNRENYFTEERYNTGEYAGYFENVRPAKWDGLIGDEISANANVKAELVKCAIPDANIGLTPLEDPHVLLYIHRKKHMRELYIKLIHIATCGLDETDTQQFWRIKQELAGVNDVWIDSSEYGLNPLNVFIDEFCEDCYFYIGSIFYFD